MASLTSLVRRFQNDAARPFTLHFCASSTRSSCEGTEANDYHNNTNPTERRTKSKHVCGLFQVRGGRPAEVWCYRYWLSGGVLRRQKRRIEELSPRPLHLFWTLWLGVVFLPSPRPRLSGLCNFNTSYTECNTLLIAFVSMMEVFKRHASVLWANLT